MCETCQDTHRVPDPHYPEETMDCPDCKGKDEDDGPDWDLIRKAELEDRMVREAGG